MGAARVDPCSDKRRFPGEGDTQALDGHKAKHGKVAIVGDEVIDVHGVGSVPTTSTNDIVWSVRGGATSLRSTSLAAFSTTTVRDRGSLEDLLVAAVRIGDLDIGNALVKPSRTTFERGRRSRMTPPVV